MKEGLRMDYVIRFIAGGAVVSIFAVLGDLLRPKSFAGLYGAAPSVALVTMALAFARQGSAYAAVEGPVDATWISGFKDKVQPAVANVMPGWGFGRPARKTAEPGSVKN
jgi:hypothetical protein